MQKIIRPLYFVGICLAILATAIVFVWYATGMTFASMTTDRSTNVPNKFQNFSFFSATTTTATSTNTTDTVGMSIKGAKKVNLYFSRGGTIGPNTGSTNFRVQVSPDEGTNWYYFNKLTQNLATSTYPTSLDSVTITAATSTVIVGLDLENNAFSNVRVIAVETTDGEHTAIGTAEF